MIILAKLIFSSGKYKYRVDMNILYYFYQNLPSSLNLDWLNLVFLKTTSKNTSFFFFFFSLKDIFYYIYFSLKDT